jgi:hypothetical protein
MWFSLGLLGQTKFDKNHKNHQGSNSGTSQPIFQAFDQ